MTEEERNGAGAPDAGIPNGAAQAAYGQNGGYAPTDHADGGQNGYPGGYPNGYGPGYYVPKLRPEAEPRDRVAALLLLILSVLAANLSLYGGFRGGYPVAFVSLMLCGTVYLGGSARPRPFALFCALAGAASSAVLLWHADSVTNFYAFCASIALAMLGLVSATPAGRYDGGGVGLLADGLHMLFVRPLNALGTAVGAVLRRRKDPADGQRRGGVGIALLGLLCALPVVAVLIWLLSSADAAFEGLLNGLPQFNITEWIVSLLLGIALFGIVFSRLFSLRRRLELPQPVQRAAERDGAPAAMLNTFLAAVCAVYALFLVSQLAYFSSAFAGILPKAFTVAEYARRGFFEMAAVCTIDLLLVWGITAASGRRAGRAPLSTRLLCLFVLLFSLGLVAASVAKMALYVGSFGLTRPRVCTFLFMLMMGVLLLAVAVRLFAPHFAYMKVGIVAMALIGLGAAYADVDTVIARYNVHSYLDGTLTEMDVETIGSLSDGATPYLIELMEQSRDRDISERAGYALYDRLREYGLDTKDTLPQEDVRAFNIDRVRERRLLQEKREDILLWWQRYREDMTGEPIDPETGLPYPSSDPDATAPFTTDGWAPPYDPNEAPHTTEDPNDGTTEDPALMRSTYGT